MHGGDLALRHQGQVGPRCGQPVDGGGGRAVVEAACRQDAAVGMAVTGGQVHRVLGDRAEGCGSGVSHRLDGALGLTQDLGKDAVADRRLVGQPACRDRAAQMAAQVLQDCAFCLIAPQVVKGLIVGIQRCGERFDRQREDPFGRVLSTGGFHNGAAAPAINWLTASWADLALVAQRQVTAMHSATSGLPHLLAPAGFIPGASGGATNLFGWVATGLVEEARALAAPTLLPATINDTQNDIATPTFGAYRSQHRAAECLDSVLAILALVSSQALSVTSRHPAPPLAGLLNGIRSVFPPVQTEREGQGTQAAELAAIFSRAALTGQPDFPSHRAQASPQPSP